MHLKYSCPTKSVHHSLCSSQLPSYSVHQRQTEMRQCLVYHDLHCWSPTLATNAGWVHDLEGLIHCYALTLAKKEGILWGNAFSLAAGRPSSVLPGTTAMALPEAALQRWMFSTSPNKTLLLAPDWCFTKAVLTSTWAALHRSHPSDFLFCVKATEEMEEFSKQLRNLWFMIIPAWEILKVRDLRFSSIFKQSLPKTDVS